MKSKSYNMFLERFKIPFIFLWVVLLFEPVLFHIWKVEIKIPLLLAKQSG